MVIKKRSCLNLIIFLILSLSISKYSLAQEPEKGTYVFLSPRITLGYTFNSGFNYGVDLAVGLYKLNDFKFGTAFSYYLVNTNQGIHRIKGFTIMADSKYFNIRLGAGAVVRRWGMRNINKASAPGLIVDISASPDAYKAPWIGIKAFLFKRSKWVFYDHPTYTSAYTYFRTPDIEIFKQNTDTEDGQ